MSKSGPPSYGPPPSNTPTYCPPSTSPTYCPPTVGQVTVTTSYAHAHCSGLGPHSQVTQCPSCHARVATRVQAETSMKTHLIAALLCFVSCCCLPYCFDSCKDINHYCPNCNAFIGKH